MKKVRFAWKTETVDEEEYKPTPSWALRHLKEYLRKLGVEEFEVVFQEELNEYDSEMINLFYLLKTDKEFILARVTTHINELDVLGSSISVWAIETSLAKRIARGILTKQVPLDEWVISKEG